MAVPDGKRRIILTLSDFLADKFEEVASSYNITKSQLLSYMIVNEFIADSPKLTGIDSMISCGYFNDKEL